MSDKRKTDSNDLLVENLFRKYYKILRAYAFRLSGDRNMAEDIVQDVYYELWKRRKGLILENAIKYYLFRAIYTKALNYLNSKSYANEQPFEQSTEGQIQQIYLQSHLTDQESGLIYEELQNEVNAAILALPEQCRKVFILSREGNLKNHEIAKQLGISEKTVEKHITKALSTLRLSLKNIDFILLLSFFL